MTKYFYFTYIIELFHRLHFHDYLQIEMLLKDNKMLLYSNYFPLKVIPPYESLLSIHIEVLNTQKKSNKIYTKPVLTHDTKEFPNTQSI